MLTVQQHCDPTPDGSAKEPFHFPLKVGLVGGDGNDCATKTLEITKPEETFTFQNISEKAIPSINRGFSAPIKVHTPYTNDDLMFLMAHDNDSFNRWEHGQELATQLMLEMVEKKEYRLDEGYLHAFEAVLKDDQLDNAIKARTLILPNESTLHQRQGVIDFDHIHKVRESIGKELGAGFTELLHNIYDQHHSPDEPYHFDPISVGKRSLKNVCLGYLCRTEDEEAIALCEQQFKTATNMTDEFAALTMLANIDCPQRLDALASFYEKWNHNPLVMQKWLAVQATSKLQGTLAHVKELMNDPIFDIKVPNCVRALFDCFTQNHIHFHTSTGEGYSFLADQIIALNAINPLLAARSAGVFGKYGKLDTTRKPVMKKELEKILEAKDLSSNVYEIVSKCLKQ